MNTFTRVLTLVCALVIINVSNGLAQISSSLKAYISSTVVPAVGILYTQAADGTFEMRCTATAIASDKDTYTFLTAAHCGCSDNDLDSSTDQTFYYITPDTPGSKIFIRAEIFGCGTQALGHDYFLLTTDKSVKFTTLPLGVDPSLMDSIINVSSPGGFGKQVLFGTVTNTKVDRSIISPDVNWTGAILLQLPGITYGSSGSVIVCVEQKAICGILVGSLNKTTIVAIPISNLKAVLAARDAEKSTK